MNIYVLLKRTFDTEEKIRSLAVPYKKMVLNILSTHMTNTVLKKRFRFATVRMARLR
jgi:hypothetical protein